MKVFNNPQVAQVMKGYQKQLNRTEKTEPAAMARDKIEISEEARDYQTAMKAFRELPEVRQQRIEELKQLIQSGQYKPSAEAVAEKILESVKRK